MLGIPAVCIGAAALLAAAACDLTWRLVPNILPLLLAGAALALRATEGLAGLALSGTMAFGLAVPLGLAWQRGIIGGGDAKLALSTILFVPVASIAHFVLATALIGGVLAAGFLVLRPLLPQRLAPAGRGTPLPRRLLAIEAWRIRRGSLPYAAAIAGGALFTLARAPAPWG